MKRSFFLLLYVVFCLSNGLAQNENSEQINWVTFNEAIKLQKENPKKIFMDVYTNWCGPCKMLDNNTFRNKDVINYINAHYYAVKFNAEGNESVKYNNKEYHNPNYNPTSKRKNSPHEFTYFLGVNAFPSMLFLDEKSHLIFPLRGYKNPKELELYLKMFYNDAHLKIKSKEDFSKYIESFEYTFSG